MDGKPARSPWGRWILGLLMAGVVAAAVFAGRDQVSGAPGPSSATPLDTVVLTGSYVCNVYSYSIGPPLPAPEPTPDPVVVREMSHYISISGTGAQPQMFAAPPAFGPGYGGRGVLGAGGSLPVSLGSGVGASFDDGTLEDCARFGEAIAAVARGLGCVTSPLRSREGIPIVIAEARFSFVCEGPAASEIHAVGELDRAVLMQRPGQ